MTTSNKSVRVSGLNRLALQVPDLAKAEEFYRTTWLLRDSGKEGRYRAFSTTDARHNDFLLSEGDARLDHVGFDVASRSDLEKLIATLKDAGFPLESMTLPTSNDDRTVARFFDPDGRRVELILSGSSSHSANAEGHPLAPRKIGHVVFWTPDQERAERFYRLLGFQITDRTNAGMSFLRCNTDHHTVALMKSSSGKTGLQHVAFDVCTLDNVMKNLGRLKAAGVEIAWGVGRHGPGDNVFSYYTDPAGNFIEYYGEMEKFRRDDGVITKIWGAEHKGDVWGVAGIPPLSFRE